MSDLKRCGMRCSWANDGGPLCNRAEGIGEHRCGPLTIADLYALPGLVEDIRKRLAPGSSTGQRVSGTRERPLGVAVDPLSFIGPHTDDSRPMRLDMGGCVHLNYADVCGPCAVTGHRFEPEPLQVGVLPLVDTLAAWARTVMELRRLSPARSVTPGTWESTLPGGVWEWVTKLQGDRLNRGWLPAPRSQLLVPALVAFLAPHHPFLAEHELAADWGEEIRRTAHHARTLARAYDEPPQLMAGVPCRRCDYASLVRYPGKSDVECARKACQAVLRPQEYTDWCRLYAANPKVARDELDQVTTIRATADALAEDPALHRHVADLRALADEIEEWTPRQRADRYRQIARLCERAKIPAEHGARFRQLAGQTEGECA